MATYDDFQKLDIRVGKIIEIKDFPEAKKPAYTLEINFGKEIGIKKSTDFASVDTGKNIFLT